MKRQKRDMAERAYSKGYQAGSSGRAKEHCPHDGGETRQQWLTGWREGRTDQWDGLTGVSGIHRMEMR